MCIRDRAEVMRPDEGPEPEIFSEFLSMTGLELCELSRYEFYGACKEKMCIRDSLCHARIRA